MPKSEQLRKQAKRKQKPARDGDPHQVASSPAPFQGVQEMSASKRPLYPIFEASDDAGGDEDAVEDSSQHVEKKRRLSVEQVKSLERYFEVENKLEPERKLQLARELGLQPRQVAVWFQNRRARWKTKQLEKDYDALKLNLDALKCDYETLLQEKLKLEAEVQRLNQILSPRMRPESDEEVVLAAELEVKLEDETELCNEEQELTGTTNKSKTANKNNKSKNNNSSNNANLLSPLPCKKDCSSSDSDGSEILDEESTPVVQQQNHDHQHHHHQQQQQDHQARAQLEQQPHHCHQQQQQQQVMLDMDPLLADGDDSYVRLFQDGYTRVPKLEDASPSSFHYDDVGNGDFIALEDQDQGWWEWP